ncbi:hypothetical protein HMI54_000266 [Coelomomyces lativittatus]|nr:hypothetical protein HMI56_005529 [Coelomomyces lativittatus]KAJ1512133.1 hypothetical protein HMI54_000266 [Coelomomyces lativittatus]KAJ1517764.1 hypothetical protein HMI55_006078 [Coelomomyces lativittatus]
MQSFTSFSKVVSTISTFPSHSAHFNRATLVTSLMDKKRNVDASNGMKKRYLLVFDLNGCLLNRLSKHEKPSGPVRECLPPVECTVKGRPVYLRPYVKDLFESLWTLHESLDLAIWSSAEASTLHALLKCWLSPKQQQKLKFTWHRRQCTLAQSKSSWKSLSSSNLRMKTKETNDPKVKNGAGSYGSIHSPSRVRKQETHMEEPSRVESKSVSPWATYKDLSKIYATYPMYHPSTTLIVEDSQFKCHLNPLNMLQVPSWFNLPSTLDSSTPHVYPKHDTLLVQLKDYVWDMIQAQPNDVRAYVQQSPPPWLSFSSSSSSSTFSSTVYRETSTWTHPTLDAEEEDFMVAELSELSFINEKTRKE